jgi:hypothetical protein
MIYTTYCKRCGEYFESDSLVAVSNWNRMHERCTHEVVALGETSSTTVVNL